jgi:hypothetical protein
MAALIQMVIGLCLLRVAPQDLPHSRVLEALAVLAYASLSFVIALFSVSGGYAIVAAAVDTGMLVALAYGGLWVLDLRNRSTKLITALAASGALWQLFTIPVVSMISGEPSSDTPSTVAQIGTLLYLALILWAVAIIGNILRHAFNLKIFYGLGIAVLYVYTSMRVGSALFVAAQPS